MQLKRLEVYGFKSFADKTVMEFPEGITAIVGPNGSGKSNVADAIRWVLGEQSAKELRGEKVGDFIFNGSNTRHQLGYAMVSLTFDNSTGYLATDFTEVTVTRKAYRSGESEYYLNRSRCRLKDIQELFFDIGFGRNSFAMISQGQVKSLIEARPLERRQLFDDACGINKYKAKKEETLRKLERTELDLSRAKDIAHELDNRLGPLQEAKEKAEKYLRLSELLKGSEKELALSEYLFYKETISSKKAEKEKLENTAVEFGKDLNVLEAERAVHQSKLQSLEEKLSVMQEDLYFDEQKLQELNGDLRVFSERQAHLFERVRFAKEALRKTADRIDVSEHRLKEAKKRQQGLVEKSADLQKKVAKKRSELECYLDAQRISEEEIEKIKDELFSLSHIASEHINCRSELQKDIELKKVLLSKETKTLEDYSFQANQLQSQKVDLAEKITLSEKEILESKEAIKGKTADIAAMKQQLAHKTAEFERQTEKHREQKAQHGALLSTETDLVGYHAGVKAVLRSGLSGILGVVAKLIGVPDTLTKATEAILGNQLQGIVTVSDSDAKVAIEHLRVNRLGKATFYPLNLLQKRSLNKGDRKLLESPGILGLLEDFLTPSGESGQGERNLATLISYLGGRVFVAEDLDSARHLAKQSHGRYPIVTRNGEVIWPGGTISGGEDVKERIGLLERQALLKRLEEKIKTQNKHLKDEKRELSVLREVVYTKENRLRKLEDIQRADKLDLESFVSSLKDLEREIAIVVTNIDLAKQSKKDLSSDIAGFQAQLLVNVQKIADLEKKQQRLRGNLERLTDKKWTQEPLLRTELQRLNEEQAIINERIEMAKNLISEEKSAKEAISDELKDAYAGLDNVLLEQIKERLSSQNIDRKRIILLFKTEIKRRDLERQKQTKAKLLDSLYTAENKLKELRPKVADIELALRSKTAEYARLEGQMENLETRLVEFDIDKDDHRLDSILTSEEKTELKRGIKELKRQIDQLGLVNLQAIKEYEEVSVRHDFLSGQIRDLLAAKTDLVEVFSKLDKQCREKFLKAFDEIKKEFEELFCKLFGGGQATLFIEDGDVLEAGIDIKAQPPGKRLQSIALLSGGEKALTALALVFAVISARRVPFYLFDEVDAPLDEANLLRFLDLIVEKGVYSQIILITHRRRSMEKADLLYGVVMEEKGVSKILALSLADENAAVTLGE